MAGNAGAATTLGAGGPNPLGVDGSFVAVLEAGDAPRWVEHRGQINALEASPDGGIYTLVAFSDQGGNWGTRLARYGAAAGIMEWELELTATRGDWVDAMGAAPDGGVAVAGTFDGAMTIESFDGSSDLLVPGGNLSVPVAVGITAAGAASWAATGDPQDFSSSYGIRSARTTCC